MNARGGISKRYVRGLFVLIHILWLRFVNETRGPSCAARQATALRAEGVEVSEDAMSEYTVDLGRFGWFPDVLPSEAGMVESSDEDEDEAAYHT
jgi:methylated-DNA-protein-cysteine methyltransferase-like protein